ncbi:type II toxin-antitoxin system CcdA family antitoxin [Aurantimonas sp. E1-2-R+4]|uniref:type II toxin-antitoxin system CcdA family antitoxin n=1 Tax=Aurantimonas sp. E1-2-R+4 TaxID=3113714 RepID=UPI002F946506
MPNPAHTASLAIDPTLFAEAKALKIDLAKAAEEGIAKAVRAVHAAQWQEANEEALASSNRYVETEGTPLARHRLF